MNALVSIAIVTDNILTKSSSSKTIIITTTATATATTRAITQCTLVGYLCAGGLMLHQPQALLLLMPVCAIVTTTPSAAIAVRFSKVCQ
jgi:hypothetical protein